MSAARHERKGESKALYTMAWRLREAAKDDREQHVVFISDEEEEEGEVKGNRNNDDIKCVEIQGDQT